MAIAMSYNKFLIETIQFREKNNLISMFLRESLITDAISTIPPPLPLFSSKACILSSQKSLTPTPPYDVINGRTLQVWCKNYHYKDVKPFKTIGRFDKFWQKRRKVVIVLIFHVFAFQQIEMSETKCQSS